MRRTAFLSAALGALLACAHQGPAPSSGPRRAAFTPYPETAIAGWKNPHAFRDAKPLCQACHAPDTGAVRGDAIALCTACHGRGGHNHPVGVVQASGAEGLPLLEGRRIACHTCHDPHDVKKQRGGLRMPYNAMCVRCHTRHHAPAAQERAREPGGHR
jgi:predicted CXXCH cytochrome family protein